MRSLSSKLLTLTLALCFGLSACSDSNKTPEVLPPDVSYEVFGYVKNSGFYKFDPIEETSQLVEDPDNSESFVYSPNGHMILLDTDKSFTSNEDKLSKTATPEHVIYAVDNEIKVYDILLNRVHTLADLNKIEEDKQHLCDLRPVQILDERSRLEGVRLILNELSAYLKTSTDPNCESTSFNYYKLVIFESDDPDDTFERREISLGEHNHPSLHSHNHEEDGHAHSHLYSDGQIDEDGNVFDSEYHIHNHYHEHPLSFGDLPEHDYLSAAELAKVHNNPANQVFSFESHPILKGTVQTTTEALMYAAEPVMLSQEEDFEYGYLGFNSRTRCLEFYFYQTSNQTADTAARFREWSISVDNPSSFLADQCYTQDAQLTTFNEEAQPIDLEYTKGGVLFKLGNALFEIPIEVLTDDDEVFARALRITNPIMDSENYSFSYSKDLDTLLLSQNGLIELSRGASDFSENFVIKDYRENNLRSIDPLSTNDNLFVLKGYSESEAITAPCTVVQGNCALVHIDNDNYFETTIAGVDLGRLFIQPNVRENNHTEGTENELLFLHRENLISNEFRSTIYSPSLIEIEEFEHSFWATVRDLRRANNTKKLLLRSGKTTLINENSEQYLALSTPQVYIYDPLNGFGDQYLSYLGKIPGRVARVIQANIVNDFYGYIEVSEDHSIDGPTKTYFFPTGKSFINPIGNFGEMKLMYQTNEPETEEANSEEVSSEEEGLEEDNSEAETTETTTETTESVGE